MQHIVDLHIHSHHSRATSKHCDLEGLYRWGKLKGIHVIGTGDFTHPGWFAEIRESLESAEPGLWTLKKERAEAIDATLPAHIRVQPLRFVPTVEISTIYSKGGRVRKLHQLLVVPTLEAVSEINARLDRIGNLSADGRPILGLDSKELLKILLDVEPGGLFIPAHIWTPWFGMFGSKSGFDSLEEAYEELAPHIHAIETGLSSDPAMNARVADLDRVAIISNSDAHSPQKLGREATVINSDLSYEAIADAIRANDERLVGTIEFFPQEGKYHSDGHRTCGVRFTPEQTKQHNGLCPKCGKSLVVGVDYRVEELASRPNDYVSSHPKQVEYIVPLPEIVAELKQVKSVSSVTVQQECQKIYDRLGNEFDVLRSVPTRHIRDAGFELLAEGIERMRKQEIFIESGYDGIFGTISVFKDVDDMKRAGRQTTLL